LHPPLSASVCSFMLWGCITSLSFHLLYALHILLASITFSENKWLPTPFPILLCAYLLVPVVLLSLFDPWVWNQ
jgi:uncharacterized protein with PQ loop repeat